LQFPNLELSYDSIMTVPIKLALFAGKIIAIDGPAGSGKSTTAKALAKRLGYTFLDTGAMYRAVALFALQNGISFEDGNALTQIAARIKIEFKNDEVKGQSIFLNGEDVTEAIRTPDVTRGSTLVAVHAGVRKEMVHRQQVLGHKGSIVAEGRDMASVVFPHADLKIYLTADLKTRARRRFLEAVHHGENTTIEEQEKLVMDRDMNDSNRKESPLRQVKEAVVVDTSGLSIEEQVEAIIHLARKAFSMGV
jgi:CMP/dCMP kinase